MSEIVKVFYSISNIRHTVSQKIQCARCSLIFPVESPGVRALPPAPLPQTDFAYKLTIFRRFYAFLTESGGIPKWEPGRPAGGIPSFSRMYPAVIPPVIPLFRREFEQFLRKIRPGRRGKPHVVYHYFPAFPLNPSPFP